MNNFNKSNNLTPPSQNNTILGSQHFYQTFTPNEQRINAVQQKLDIFANSNNANANNYKMNNNFRMYENNSQSVIFPRNSVV
jgi:hypothetical protein